MLLLAIASLLLFFIIHFTGVGAVAVLSKWLRLPLQADFLGVFLTGLVAFFVYCSLASFLVPVDAKVLVLPLVAALLIFFRPVVRRQFYQQLKAARDLFFYRMHLPFTLAFLIILFLFWAMPPGNWDSGEYHYLSIRWYETYRVVPGLANLHSRLAFNPANFIVSAPFTFSTVFGQALYPLNGVLALLYFGWLLRLLLQTSGAWIKTLLVVYTILQFRDMVLNISSPSSDLLVAVLVSYCGLHTFLFLQQQNLTITTAWVLLLLIAFSITAKLSATPLLLLLPLLWWGSRGKKGAALFRKTVAVLAMLWLPWLVRNAIMSGYFLYPIGGTNFIAFDWTVPKEVLLLDDFYTRYATHAADMPKDILARMSLWQLISTWMQESFRYKTVSFGISIAAFVLPPATALYLAKKKVDLPPPVWLLGGIYYVAALIWLVYAPEFRFGLCLLHLLLLLALWPVAASVVTTVRWLRPLQLLLLLCTVAYFIRDYNTRLSNQYFHLADSWWLPARDYRYTLYKNREPFLYTTFENGIRLYLSDSTHECMTADLPCMSWRYGKIEMRGATLQEGFRNVKNEVRLHFPFLP